MNKTNRMKRAAQNGFTLIELLIVVSILGVLAAILAPIVNNNLERRSTARAVQAFADNAQKSVRSLLVSSGTAANVTTSPLVGDPANNFLDILVGGAPIVAANFARAYADSGVATLDRAVTITTAPAVGTAGAYTIRDYPVTVSSPSNGLMNVVLTGVPSDVVERLKADREGNAAFDPATADTTGAVQYGVADGNGNHTLTLQVSIS